MFTQIPLELSNRFDVWQRLYITYGSTYFGNNDVIIARFTKDFGAKSNTLYPQGYIQFFHFYSLGFYGVAG